MCLEYTIAFMILLLTIPWISCLKACCPSSACLEWVNKVIKFLVWCRAVLLNTQCKTEPEASSGLVHPLVMYILHTLRRDTRKRSLVRVTLCFALFSCCLGAVSENAPAWEDPAVISGKLHHRCNPYWSREEAPGYQSQWLPPLSNKTSMIDMIQLYVPFNGNVKIAHSVLLSVRHPRFVLNYKHKIIPAVFPISSVWTTADHPSTRCSCFTLKRHDSLRMECIASIWNPKIDHRISITS